MGGLDALEELQDAWGKVPEIYKQAQEILLREFDGEVEN